MYKMVSLPPPGLIPDCVALAKLQRKVECATRSGRCFMLSFGRTETILDGCILIGNTWYVMFGKRLVPGENEPSHNQCYFDPHCIYVT